MNAMTSDSRFIAGPYHTNRHMRRSQYAVPSRSRPERIPRNPELKSMQVVMGRDKIMTLMNRGYHINKRKPVKVSMKPIISGVRRALFGGA